MRKENAVRHHSHTVGDEFIKAINNVSIPCGVWIRFRKINTTYFPFPLGDYRIMRVQGEEFTIVKDPLSFIFIRGCENIPVNGETTLRDLSVYFQRRLPIHDEPILDHNGFNIMKLKSGQYIPALACFAGSSYKQKEVFASTSIHKVTRISIKENNNLDIVIDENPIEKPKTKHKKDNATQFIDTSFDLNDYYNQLNEAAILCDGGAKSKRKSKKSFAKKNSYKDE